MSETYKVKPPEPPAVHAGMPYTGIATFARAPLAGGQGAAAARMRVRLVPLWVRL